MGMKIKKNVLYYLLLLSSLVRMSWLSLMEPNGAVRAQQKHSDLSTMVGFSAKTIPYIVYPSIVILAVIIIGIILKKHWSYLAALIFASIHLALILTLVVLHTNTGYGPLVVIPANTGMIVFSLLMLKSDRRPVRIAEGVKDRG